MNYIYLERKTSGIDTSIHFISNNDIIGCKEWIMKKYEKLLNLKFTNARVFTFEDQQEKINISINPSPKRIA